MSVDAPQAGAPLVGALDRSLAEQTESLWVHESTNKRTWVFDNKDAPIMEITTYDTFAQFDASTLKTLGQKFGLPWQASPQATQLRVRVWAVVQATILDVLVTVKTATLITAVATTQSPTIALSPIGVMPYGEWHHRADNPGAASFGGPGTQPYLGFMEVLFTPTLPADRRFQIQIFGKFQAIANPFTPTQTRVVKIATVQVEDVIEQPAAES